jgi:hypothetical protein
MALVIVEQWMKVEWKNRCDHGIDYTYAIEFDCDTTPRHVFIKSRFYMNYFLYGETILPDEYLARAYTTFYVGSMHKIVCIRDDKHEPQFIEKLIAIDDYRIENGTNEEILASMKSVRCKLTKPINNIIPTPHKIHITANRSIKDKLNTIISAFE